MRKKLIKLPGGKVVAFRPAPIAKHLAEGAADTQVPDTYAPVPRQDLRQGRAASVISDSNRQVMDLNALEGLAVLIIGCGAIGGYVASMLAAAAALTIFIIDFDVVDYRHTQGARTIFEARHVRRKKVYAAKEKLERQYPLSRIVPYPYDVLQLPDIVLTQLARKADVVIDAIDAGAGMLRINDLLYPIVEVLHAGVHPEAASGHVILTSPFATPCLRCCMDIDSADGVHTLDAEPALGSDIRAIANHTVTIALELMHARVTGRPIERWDVSRNIFYIANRQGRHSPDGPGVILQQGHKRHGCPVCGADPHNVL
jgi:molybdopterin/thiamine biosynthesis adenylyltransferase